MAKLPVLIVLTSVNMCFFKKMPLSNNITFAACQICSGCMGFLLIFSDNSLALSETWVQPYCSLHYQFLTDVIGPHDNHVLVSHVILFLLWVPPENKLSNGCKGTLYTCHKSMININSELASLGAR